MPSGRSSRTLRVRFPEYGVNGAWHVVMVLLVTHMDAWTALPASAVLGWLIGRDVAAVFFGVYVRVGD
jgi:uncharacterized membrane protein AbrB (regulator of aidB expression)